MKIAYYDCFVGDMILGARIHTDLNLEELRDEQAKRRLGHYSVDGKKVMKRGNAGTQAGVFENEDRHHQRRHLHDIKEISLRA